MYYNNVVLRLTMFAPSLGVYYSQQWTLSVCHAPSNCFFLFLFLAMLSPWWRHYKVYPISHQDSENLCGTTTVFHLNINWILACFSASLPPVNPNNADFTSWSSPHLTKKRHVSVKIENLFVQSRLPSDSLQQQAKTIDSNRQWTRRIH